VYRNRITQVVFTFKEIMF